MNSPIAVFQLFARPVITLFILIKFFTELSKQSNGSTFIFNIYVMKTIITIGVLITASLFSELSFAGGNFKVNVALKSESKNLTEISNNTEQKYDITISDLTGEVLYHRQAQGEQLESSKIFDFAKSEPGVYNMKVEFNGGSSEQLVTVTKNGIEVGEIVSKAEPIFSFKDNLLLVSFLNQNNEAMKLDVYSNENLVYEKKFDQSKSLVKKFDLSKLDTGDYQVVFTTGEDQYEYYLAR